MDFVVRYDGPRPLPKLDRAGQAAAIREANRHIRLAKQSLERARIEHPLEEVAVLIPPDWRPGDVVVVRYVEHRPYTYVRGNRGWLREFEPDLLDADMNKLYQEGKVKPVLQRGGDPFAPARIAP